MTYRDYRFLSCATFRLFPINEHCFFLIVGIFGRIQIYTFFPPSLPFPFVSSSSYAFLIASLSPVLLLVKCIRSLLPSALFFLVFCALIALEPVLEQVLCGISLSSVFCMVPTSWIPWCFLFGLLLLLEHIC